MQDMKEHKNPWHEPLVVFGKVSGWVVAPVVIALFLGRFLDKKFDSEPIIFLGLTGFAFLVSCFGIYREAALYLKHIETTYGTRHNDNNPH